jgi:hypothetical protein
MHYTAMLAYRGLGDKDKADREQKLFERFKTNESAQSITAKRRLASPEDNNERQTIHDHESVPLDGKTLNRAAPVDSVSTKPKGTPIAMNNTGESTRGN